MRHALQLEIENSILFGTLHDQESQIPASGQPDSKRTGILLISFGQQPRSWVGDLGCSIADRLCASGYPTFRFDMPGLGDSPGDIPVHFEELAREIQLGEHERPLQALCEQLVDLFSLKGIVVGGFCGGSVTALYSINARSPILRGLVLLEPEMALVRTSASIDQSRYMPLTVDNFQERANLFWKRLFSLDSWFRLFSGKADLGFWFDLFDSATRKLINIGRRNRPLPVETNFRMLNSWQLARRLKTPTLVISVGSQNRRKYYRAYGMEPGVSNIRNRLCWIEVPDTTHALLTGGAKEAVGIHLENWIRETFPSSIS